MEANSWRPTQPELSAGAGGDGPDWRSQLPPDSRNRIVNKIMETLKRHLPMQSASEGLTELQKFAVRFEETIYSSAISQADYLRKISLKMLSMETKTQQAAPANPTGSNGNGPNQNPSEADSCDPNYLRPVQQIGKRKRISEEHTHGCKKTTGGDHLTAKVITQGKRLPADPLPTDPLPTDPQLTDQVPGKESQATEQPQLNHEAQIHDLVAGMIQQVEITMKAALAKAVEEVKETIARQNNETLQKIEKIIEKKIMESEARLRAERGLHDKDADKPADREEE